MHVNDSLNRLFQLQNQIEYRKKAIAELEEEATNEREALDRIFQNPFCLAGIPSKVSAYFIQHNRIEIMPLASDDQAHLFVRSFEEFAEQVQFLDEKNE